MRASHQKEMAGQRTNRADMEAQPRLLQALANGRLIALGSQPIRALRTLSDGRQLACPHCGAPVVLRAGPLVAAHFAHMPGTVCARDGSEPESAEHRAGKVLLADWVAEKLPDAVLTTETPLPNTRQRPDLLLTLADGGQVALEYQCADLAPREWLRRNAGYRANGIRDLWILGTSRLQFHGGVLRCADLERAMLAAGAPLLYLDSLGEHHPAGTVCRFRPSSGGAAVLKGRLSWRELHALPFPLHLLDWPQTPIQPPESRSTQPPDHADAPAEGEYRLREWLKSRYRVDPDALPDLFGARVRGQEAFACRPELWQAAIYYRFIQGRVGEQWWIGEVETFARRYLPLASRNPVALRRALRGLEAIFSAAGLLSIPRNGCARVEADFQSLGRIPDREAAERLAAYRRTLAWRE